MFGLKLGLELTCFEYILYSIDYFNDSGSFEFFYAPLPWSGPSFSLTTGLNHRILMESFDWSISPSGKMLAYRDEGWLRLRIIDWSDTSFTPL